MTKNVERSGRGTAWRNFVNAAFARGFEDVGAGRGFAAEYDRRSESWQWSYEAGRTVTAANRPVGTLEHDMGKLIHQRWRWRSASGAIDTFFPTKTEAREHIAWVADCRPVDVYLVERQQEEEAA